MLEVVCMGESDKIVVVVVDAVVVVVVRELENAVDDAPKIGLAQYQIAKHREIKKKQKE
jgi:hypothetical protein